MGVNFDALLDLVATTTKNLPNDIYEMMWDNHAYEFNRVYKENKKSLSAGTSIQRNVILDENGRASYRSLYDTDTPVVDQNQHTIDVPWTLLGTNYSWDVVEILNQKDSKEGFIDLIESRRNERMWGLSNLIENKGWLAPSSATDKKNPYGVPYYLNMLDDGSTTGGFVGKTIRFTGGTTGTICAGIDASVEPKWRNFADVYTKIDNSLLRKMRSAVRRTRFKPSPLATTKGTDAGGKVGQTIRLYANDSVCTEMEDLADKRDDNNTPDDLAGKMLHNYEGAVYFNKMPLVYIDQLDGLTVTGGSGTSNIPDPIYCIDWSKIQPVVREGYWMVESKPMYNGNQHTVLTVYVDGSHNNLCVNRRTAGFVIHKALTA